MTMHRREWLAGSACWSAGGGMAAAATSSLAQEPPDDFAKWRRAIEAFEASDRDSPPAKEGVLFVGSSSIRLWKLSRWFADLPTVNRGFGGSHLADSVHYAERIVLPHRPRVVVVYAGDNDIKAGKSPERVHRDFRALVAKIHARLPRTRIVFVAIKPSLARWSLVDKMRDANRRIRATCEADLRLDFVDADQPMIGDDGRPRPELFVKDGLHLSDEGYRLWTSLVDPLVRPARRDRYLAHYQARRFDDGTEQLLYRLLVPANQDGSETHPTDEPRRRLRPLILFLHGAGERGDDNKRQLVHAAAEMASDEIRRRFPCYVVAPQCPAGAQWVEAPWTKPRHRMPAEPSAPMRAVLRLVESLVDELPVDPRRIYVTGLSMGGFGTWDAACREPDRFAAVAPVCGGADLDQAERIKHVPAWVFHGARDTVVKPALSREMVAALRKAGAEPKYTEYPEAGHDSWTPAYNTVALYEWMFVQSR